MFVRGAARPKFELLLVPRELSLPRCRLRSTTPYAVADVTGKLQSLLTMQSLTPSNRHYIRSGMK
jgi:hypothetical protein